MVWEIQSAKLPAHRRMDTLTTVRPLVNGAQRLPVEETASRPSPRSVSCQSAHLKYPGLAAQDRHPPADPARLHLPLWRADTYADFWLRPRPGSNVAGCCPETALHRR